ncbi:MAG TPA: POTRA domain-containing protein [Luteimonas sp.]|nr:POTRA domain-containing protein [Luteimonas sp.]
MRTVARFCAAAALSAASLAQAQTRLPATNPLQTLPKAEVPKQEPKVSTTIQPQQNPQLAALLATQIVPKRFDVSGVAAVPFDDVAAFFFPLAGKTITVADLLQAADRCTGAYKKHGFALSFCYVPTQDFADGVVKIIAVEGYVADVSVSGDVGKLDKRIRAIARRIAADRPLRQATFDRYSQILGFLPGAKIAINVPVPTTTDGATKLELQVTRKRFDGSYALDFNHPGVQGLGTFNANALTSLAEQWSLSALYPPGRGSQHFYSGAYSQLLGSDGLSLRLDASRFRGEPDDRQLPDFLRHDVSQDRYSFSLRYPLLLRPTRVLFLGGGAYAANQSDRYLNTNDGASLELQTRARVIHAEIDYASSSATGDASQRAGLGVSRGLDAWGASSRVITNIPGAVLGAPSDVSFTRYNLSYAQGKTWKNRIGAVFSLVGQYSGDRLPTSEQIAFGGPRYALAYDPGSASGDSGWGASLELNRSFARGSGWVKSWVPYLAGQYARVYLNRAQPAIDRLGTVALGLRLSDNKRYNIDFSVAQPTADAPLESDSGRRKTRLNLTFAYDFR